MIEKDKGDIVGSSATRKYLKTKGAPCAPLGNMPKEYADLQTRYMGESTKAYIQKKAYISSDYVLARVQGLDKNDFYAYKETKIRFSDVTTTDATNYRTGKADNFKRVLFAEPKIDYFPLGAMIETMGSFFVCINPNNLSDEYVTAVVAKCNTTYNTYDAYGNIIKTPIAVSREAMYSDDNKTPENLVLPDGYFTVFCQLNPITKTLTDNKRLILGNMAYSVTGFTDFVQEFTTDSKSTHFLTLTVHREEPNDMDDMENKVAGGLNISYSAVLNGINNTIRQGTTAAAAPDFLINGKRADLPCSWTFLSSDESILTVDENGAVYAVSVGKAKITAVLQQNPKIFAEREVEVILEPVYTFCFESEPETFISQFQSAQYSVNDTNVLWETRGADERCYALETNGNTAIVTCIYPSDVPLVLSAADINGQTVSVSIQLLGV